MVFVVVREVWRSGSFGQCTNLLSVYYSVPPLESLSACIIFSYLREKSE